MAWAVLVALSVENNNGSGLKVLHKVEGEAIN